MVNLQTQTNKFKDSDSEIHSSFFQILALETITGSLQTLLYFVHHYTLHGFIGSFQHFSLPYCPFYWHFTGIKPFWMIEWWWMKYFFVYTKMFISFPKPVNPSYLVELLMKTFRWIVKTFPASATFITKISLNDFN